MNDFNETGYQVANDAQQEGRGAAGSATGRAYATDAVNAAGKRIGNVKSQFDQGCEHLVKAINDEPLKAVLITAVVSSLLTVWATSSFRGNSRYC